MSFSISSFAIIAFLLAAVAPAAAGSEIVQFDFGSYHRCSLTAGGAVDCLGDSNVFGQIGNGKTDDQGSPRPVRVIARGARKVVTGNYFTCAIVGDALQCWGDLTPRKGGTLKPVTLIAHGVVDAAAGQDRVCAIVGTAVQCAGAGVQSGGNDYPLAHPTPETVIAHDASAVTVGDYFACAVVDGALSCWGKVPAYSLDKSGFIHPIAPTHVIERAVSAVAAGANHVCAIVDGALWCWGDNSHGQVGIGIPDIPVTTASGLQGASVTEGEQHCWRGRFDSQPTCIVAHPVEVVHDGVEAVVAKNDATCATVRGALHCWGQNAYGQLGIASHGADVTKPALAIAHGVGYVATGNRTCAIVDGTMQCSRPCRIVEANYRKQWQCPADAGFDTRNLPFGLSALEARLGVWRGSIGPYAVMACLQRSPWDAQYYYIEHGTSIQLTPAPGSDGATWAEHPRGTDATATWTLADVHGETMEGQWSDAAGQRKLPIRLTRVATPGDPGFGCSLIVDPNSASRAFNAPRVGALPVETGPWNGGSRELSVLGGGVSVDELDGDAPYVGAFNTSMRQQFRDEIAAYYDCVSGDPHGEFENHRRIAWHAGPWVVVGESYDAYCGGAHGGSGDAGYQVWNLDRGKTVDPWSWIVASGRVADFCSPHSTCDLTGELRDLVVAVATRGMESGDDCADEYRTGEVSYLLQPNDKGLTFSSHFSTAMHACNDDDIEIPWAKLKPFLTPQGKAAAASMMKAAHEAKASESK